MAELAHKRHTKSWLGGLPYVGPGQELWAARHLFLMAIEEHCPAVLQSLCDDVFPHYEAYDGTYDDALLAWGGTFHLTQAGTVPGWLQSQVLKTFSMWEPYPCTRLRWELLVPVGVWQGARMAGVDRVSVTLTGAGGDGDETLADIRKRLYAEAQAAIDAHLGRVRRLAENEGLKEPRQIRRPEHYAWAVRFQLGAADVPTIASSIGDGSIDDRTVRYAIDTVLDLVGVDRRKERPGPKPKPWSCSRPWS